MNERERWAIVAGLRALQGLRDSGVDEEWIDRLQNGRQRTPLEHLTMGEIDDLCDVIANEPDVPKVENYDNWTEDAQWAAAHLVTCVPHDVWYRAGNGRPRIRIEIEDYVVQDLQRFFEDFTSAFDKEVEVKAAKRAKEKGSDLMDVMYNLAHQLEWVIRREIARRFNVRWDEDGDIRYNYKEE